MPVSMGLSYADIGMLSLPSCVKQNALWGISLGIETTVLDRPSDPMRFNETKCTFKTQLILVGSNWSQVDCLLERHEQLPGRIYFKFNQTKQYILPKVVLRFETGTGCNK